MTTRETAFSAINNDLNWAVSVKMRYREYSSVYYSGVLDIYRHFFFYNKRWKIDIIEDIRGIDVFFNGQTQYFFVQLNSIFLDLKMYK